MTKYLLLFLFFLFAALGRAQVQDTLRITAADSIVSAKALKKQARIAKREERRIKNIRPYNALAPTKAAFYSAIVPGLGQAYTGKYWKIPIVYGAIGTGIGIALWNDRNYNDIRDIYRNRLLGINTDRFYDQVNDVAIVDNEALVSAQEGYQKQKEISILVTIGLYVLNIIDANVTAHLQQYNLNQDLSLSPAIDTNNLEQTPNYGLSLNYSF